jgi:hypothetical protein
MDLFNAETDYFSFQRDFAAKFPPPLDEKVLFKDLDRYLVNVEAIVADLERLFVVDA